MAIYKNREVQVIGPSSQATSPTTIQVSYPNGSHENVKLADVRFTAAEKTALIKNNTTINAYNNVNVATDEDLANVRLGVAPTFDTTEKDRQVAKVQHEKQVAVSNKQAEALKAKALQDFESQNKPPVAAPVTPVKAV